jgi:integrase/recombinase XerC
MYTTRFFKYLEFEKRSSLHTQKAYVNDLSQCQLFIHTNYPDTDISKADHFMIRSFIINLLENETGSASIHRKISCLRSFFRFCVKESYIVQSPMNRILLPAIAKKLPVIISESKINAVLDNQEFAAIT